MYINFQLISMYVVGTRILIFNVVMFKQKRFSHDPEFNLISCKYIEQIFSLFVKSFQNSFTLRLFPLKPMNPNLFHPSKSLQHNDTSSKPTIRITRPHITGIKWLIAFSFQLGKANHNHQPQQH